MPNPPLSPQFYRDLAQQKGLTWLGPEAQSIRHLTGWTCPAGHQFSRAYRHIKGGSGCPECNKPKPLANLPETQLASHIHAFFKLKDRSWRDKTKRNYTDILTRFAIYSGDKWPVTAIDVMDWLNSTSANNTSVRSYFNHLRTFFNYLQTLAIIEADANPTRQIALLRLLPRKPKLSPKALTEADTERLLTHLRTLASTDDLTKPDQLAALRDLALIHFALITGCRASELANLRQADLDLTHLSAHIAAETAKTHQERTVFFNEAVRTDLENWLTARTKANYSGQHVFTQLKNGQPKRYLTGPGIGKLIKRHLTQIGLDDYSAHSLRHTSALMALNAGITISDISRQLGHADIATTTLYLLGHDVARAKAYANLTAT